MSSNTRNIQSAVAHPGQLKSFQIAEAKARQVLRERGLNESQIQSELQKIRRDQND